MSSFPPASQRASSSVHVQGDPWCEEEAVLTSIFALSHTSICTSQETGRIQKLCTLVKSFHADAKAAAESKEAWEVVNTELTLGCLEAASAALCSDRVVWFPKYGCAVVCMEGDAASGRTLQPQECAVCLVSLDNWEFQVHRMRSGGSSHTSVCRSHELLVVGVSQRSDWSSLVSQLNTALGAAQARVHAQRSAASNTQGHQKTPSFIYALLLQVMQPERRRVSPEGCFTDVGLHTGGRERSTCWPLVRSVAQVLMEQQVTTSQCFAQSILASFYLWLTARQAAMLHPENADAAAVTAVMEMLHKRACAGAELVDQGHSLPGFSQRCRDVQEHVQGLVELRAQVASTLCSLPANLTAATEALRAQDITATPPAEVQPVQDSQHLVKARERAIQNLTPLKDSPGKMGLPQLLGWVQQAEGKRVTGTDQHILHVIEQRLFGEHAPALNGAALTDGKQVALERVVDAYRSALHRLEQSGAAAAHMHVELRSRETLLVWVASCMLHAAALVKWPQLSGYSLPLRHTNLRDLVLRDALARDALLHVAAYLSAYSSSKVVFSLRPEEQHGSLQLAQHFSSGDAAIGKVWIAEQAAAAARQAGHWAEVQRKQQLARELRVMLAAAEEELKPHEYQLSVEQGCLQRLQAPLASDAYHLKHAPHAVASTSHVRSPAVYWRHLQQRNEWQEVVERRNAEETAQDAKVQAQLAIVRPLRACVENLKQQLRAAETSPHAVWQPLPANGGRALEVLFFFFAPPYWQRVARMTFLAQEQLLPRPWSDPKGRWDVKHEISVPSGSKSWLDYYTTRQSSQYAGGAAPAADARSWIAAKLHFASSVPPTVGSHDVDSLTRPPDGVWHPDSLLPSLAWAGPEHTAAALYNPFDAVPRKQVVLYRTEELAPKDSTLQWALPLPDWSDIDATRGNRAVASQDSKPAWLSKREYLAFGALRAYAHLQRRKLCTLLHECLLPLDQPAVQTLIRQTMYHAGELSSGAQPQLLWRRDDALGFHSTLCAELSSLADELANKPRHFQHVLMVGELAGALSEEHRPARTVAQKCARMTLAWACDVGAQLRDHSQMSPEQVLELRQKQCLLYLCGALCCGAGPAVPLEIDYVGTLCKAMLLAYRHQVVLPSSSSTQQLQALTTRSNSMMMTRIGQVEQVLSRRPALLTAAAQAALGALPDSLRWHKLSTACGCYEALHEGCLYSVNLISGAVLSDGYPPGRLPESVRQHPLYQRCFEGVDMEVTRTAQGVLRSVHDVGGQRYEFRMLPGVTVGEAGLVVREHGGDGRVLELLDPGQSLQCSWCPALPVRLRAMHSHWLCRATGTVVLRGINFRHCGTAFMLLNRSGLSGCVRVPQHLRHLPWHEAAQQLEAAEVTQHLVTYESPVLTALGKFEDPTMLHVYDLQQLGLEGVARSLHSLVFALARYGLEFELRSGRLMSVNLSGYALAQCQQLVQPCTLPDVSQYLMLEPVQPSTEATKIIVPEGVVKRNGASVIIQRPTTCSEALRHHSFELHQRHGMLTAGSIESRLHLAALYAATGSALPEKVAGMTGAERAMQLVRQSWVNRPLSESEMLKVHSIASLGYLAPALELLCYELERSASQLTFLHDSSAALPPPSSALEPNCATAYRLFRKSSAHNLRQRLTDDEELRTLYHLASPLSERLHTVPNGTVPLEPCTLNAAFVSQTEQDLAACVQWEEAASQAPPMPLVASDKPTALQAVEFQELQASWDAYHRLQVEKSVRVTAQHLTSVHSEVQRQRAQVEAYVMQALQAHAPTSRFHVLHSGACIARAAVHDVISMAWQPGLVRMFNPCLTGESAKLVHDAVLLWLQLCVLEDRMQRLVACAAAGAPRLRDLLQELQVTRSWDVRAHPQWLAFEVEGRLQIRPRQHAVAQHMIAHTGSAAEAGAIVQLNMGEGKTRVILPMLALHWADTTRVLRINLLSPLLDEACAHLHATLCAGALGRKIFQLPFNRDVQLSPSRVAVMRATLLHCQRVGGILLVAPEHRLSLQLKALELRAAGDTETCAALQLLSQMPYHDLLDESDELLRHKYQLIYAAGSVLPLPQGSARWGAVQALLRIIKLNPHLQDILSHEGVSVRAAASRPQAMPSIRLVPGAPLDAALPDLHAAILTALLAEPLLELQWLQHIPALQLSANLLDDSIPAASLPSLTDDQQSQLLALRGLLGYGVLQSCLQKRHRVEFGVARNMPTQRKRLAVPFLASDTPSQRSEYAQPDVAILLTHLAYYSDGLTRSELLQALQHLLSMGPSAQSRYYGAWFAASHDAFTSAEERASVDREAKLDLSNDVQAELLWRCYHLNTEAINYWLTFCVLLTETQCYPHRLLASAWHLADNSSGRVSGFSGTNDNRRLLPLQVTQHALSEHALNTTNGKMLSLILRNKEFVCLNTGAAQPVWQAVITFTLQHGGVALLDAGALLAGVSNRGAAEFALAQMQTPEAAAAGCADLRGVLYYDAGTGWAVCDRDGRTLPLERAQILPRDLFVLLDESRCRGVDLKLRPDALGILTLGPRMTKDKFMQAAGRLRQLDREQHLILVAAPDVAAKVHALTGKPHRVTLTSHRPAEATSTSGFKLLPSSIWNGQGKQLTSQQLTSQHCLQWVLRNTQDAQAAGLVEYGLQGLHFACVHAAPQRALRNEHLHLRQLYAAARSQQSAHSVVTAHSRSREGECEAPLSPLGADLLSGVHEHAYKYGQDVWVKSGSLDEECERETEQEKEQEEEREVEPPRQTPIKETDWQYAAAVQASSVHKLPLKVQPLRNVVAVLSSRPLHAIPWSATIFCTPNFSACVAPQAVDQYLRSVDNLLCFSDGSCLLVSDREAHCLLGVLWEAASASGPRAGQRAAAPRPTALAPAEGNQTRPVFMNLVYARRQYKLQQASATLATPGTGRSAALHPAQIASLKLFAGETQFKQHGCLPELRALAQRRLEAAGTITQLRGTQILLPCSDLEMTAMVRPDYGC